MGYYIYLSDNSFAIEKCNEEKALNALKKLVDRGASLRWIDEVAVLKAETLKEAMWECRYLLSFDETDGCYHMEEFIGQKLGIDDLIFSTLAPKEVLYKLASFLSNSLSVLNLLLFFFSNDISSSCNYSAIFAFC